VGRARRPCIAPCTLIPTTGACGAGSQVPAWSWFGGGLSVHAHAHGRERGTRPRPDPTFRPAPDRARPLKKKRPAHTTHSPPLTPPSQFRARSLRRAALRAPSFKAKARLETESEDLLRRARELDPTDGRPYVSLGRLLVQQRRTEEARALYDDGSTATGGANSHVWQAWATLEERAGNPAKARTLFDAATVADPAHAAAWHGWGMLEKRAGDPGRARDLWVKGVRLAKKDPAYAEAGPNPHLHQSLAVLAAEAGFMEEARAWFAEAVSGRDGAKSAAVWHTWALAEVRGGEPAAARYLFARGLEANPRSRYVHLSWALWEAGCGETANARRLLARGHALNRRDPAILQAWALLEARQGDADGARDLLARAAALEPRHLPVWQAWALLEARTGNAERARELFRSGVAACPDASAAVAPLWQAWGTVEAKAGDLPAARALFRAALRADPACEPAWHAWAAMEEEAGAYARADELRALRIQARTETALPRGFRASLDPARAAGGRAGSACAGAGLGTAVRGEPAAATTGASTVPGGVLAAVADWWARFENARSPSARPKKGKKGNRSPTSTTTGEEGVAAAGPRALSSTAPLPAPPPPISAMAAFNSPSLPALPDPAPRGRAAARAKAAAAAGGPPGPGGPTGPGSGGSSPGADTGAAGPARPVRDGRGPRLGSKTAKKVKQVTVEEDER